MNKVWIPGISLLLLLLVACVAPSGGGYLLTPDAAATLSAADAVHRQAANAATAQAAELTRQSAQATQQALMVTQTAVAIATATAQTIAQAQTATTESITVRASEQALSAEATFSAIAAQATGTAVAQAAIAEQHLVEDEARRLALQRQSEAAALEYRQTMNRLKPYFWGGLVLALVILAGGVGYHLYQRSRPITVTDVSGPRVLIPANSWQVLPARPSQRALPAPAEEGETAVTPIPLPPLIHGHILIAGETGSGKSTAMLAVLRRRPQVVVLDPHDTPGSWGNAQVIGGGRDFESIGRYMQQMRLMLSQRYSQRAQGMAQFEPLTVATDEMPAIVAALGRQVDEVWREWLREGRKVGLFFVVSTQSTRVKTLGIRGEGDLLENFNYVLLLGKLAVTQYPDLARPMDWPAILRTNRGIRPVHIERTPAQPTGPQAGNSPIFIAPVPQPTDFADPNNLTETIRERIRQLARELPSQAAVERAVFGYNGGAAYRAVKEVLDTSGNNNSSTTTRTNSHSPLR
ncbi:MAG: ATP-binding protein [Chloroflexi bacterium]|nr:ATP-binding protein [Chloroflexota bacterium]